MSGEEVQEEVKEEPEVSPIDELRTQYEKLKSDLEVQRQAAAASQQREMAERSARVAAEQEAAAARSETSQVQIGTLQAGAEAAQSEVEAAKIALRAAREAGDIDREVEAADRLAEAKANLITQRRDAATYSQYEAQQRQQQEHEQQRRQYEQQQQRQYQNPVEGYIQQARMSERSADWVRKHPEWISDQRRNARLVGAHYDAVDGHGLTVDSPEYFAHVERVLGLKNDKSKPPPVLPVGSPRSSVIGGEISLTKAERETATDGTLVWHYNDPNKKFKKGDPIGVEEYARRKRAMKDQGLYDKVYVSE